MKCERAVHEIFPVARAMIAKKLVDNYSFSQTKAAKRLGLSQPAISQYRKNLRGNKARSLAEDQRFVEISNDIAKRIAEGSLKGEKVGDEMCRFCRLFEDRGEQNR
jgi:predicted transcriptional regulator